MMDSYKGLIKVTVSMGFGKMEKAQETEGKALLAAITGQIPAITFARKSVSNFHVRTGMKAGLKVTLRRWRALNFVRKIVAFVLPGRSTFEGLKESCMNGASINFGLTSLDFFPEVDDTSLKGLNVNVLAADPESLRLFVKHVNIPFRSK